MTTINFSMFAFDVPDTWTHFAEAGRCVCQGTNNEELIVSIGAIASTTGTTAPPALQSTLVDAALAAMDRAASHPDLLIVAPRQRLHSSPLEVWVVRARTTDGSVRFEQCVATNGEAVLLATLESPTGTAYGIEEWIAGLRLAPKR